MEYELANRLEYRIRFELVEGEETSQPDREIAKVVDVGGNRYAVVIDQASTRKGLARAILPEITSCFIGIYNSTPREETPLRGLVFESEESRVTNYFEN